MDYLIPTALECPDFELGETGDALPAPPARGEGRRRVTERRVSPCHRQCRDRRAARVARSDARRHALHAGASLGRDAGKTRAAAVIRDELNRRAQRLAAERSPFVVATVVRVQRPASVKPGAVGLVLADGTIEGFIGGVCAQHSVRLHSLEALESGMPLLLRILPDGPDDVRVRRGSSRSPTPACPEAPSRCSSSPSCPSRGRWSRAARRSSPSCAGWAPRSGSRSSRPRTSRMGRSPLRPATSRSSSPPTGTMRSRL